MATRSQNKPILENIADTIIIPPRPTYKAPPKPNYPPPYIVPIVPPNQKLNVGKSNPNDILNLKETKKQLRIEKLNDIQRIKLEKLAQKQELKNMRAEEYNQREIK